MGDELAQWQLDTLVNRMRQSGTDLQEVEVKEAVNGLPKGMGDTLSAFANGSGGIVILGLAEKEGFTPARGFDAKRMQDALARLCSDGMEPPLWPDVAICMFEGAPVVVAQIRELPPRQKPCYARAKGLRLGSYIRVGDGDRRLTDYEIDRLLEEHTQPQYDAEIVMEASTDDLDQALLRGILDRERFVHPSISGQLSDEEMELNLRIIARDAKGELHPTLGGLLALGTYPQKYYPRLSVTFAAFPGHSKADLGTRGLLDSATLVGPIPAIVADAVTMVSRNMRMGGVIEGAFRRDAPDYPPTAVREAVTNALMHRDYSPVARGMQVQLNMYDDRLEVTNPGGLYGTLTLDMLGESGASATRNQHLSLLLEETPYPDGGYIAENRGTGYQRIMAELVSNGNPPAHPDSTASRFSLTMGRAIPATATATARNGNPEGTIVGLLGRVDSATAAEIAEELGMSRAGAMNHIRKLIARGVVEPLYPAKSPKQRYRLAK